MADSLLMTPSQPNPQGLTTPGNINLLTRPNVANPDGTHSTVRSMSFEENGKEILVPTVSDDGRIVSDQEAINNYHKTGKHLGIFNNSDSADAYAQTLHKDYEQGKIPGYPVQNGSKELNFDDVPAITQNPKELSFDEVPSFSPGPRGKPSFDINPGTEGIGPASMGVLPIAGAGLGSLVGSPMAGAGLGTATAEFLKSKFPKTFSETGEPPSTQEMGTNMVLNTGLEGGNQIINGLIKKGIKPAIAEMFASKMGQMVPGIRNATLNAQVAQGLGSVTESISNPAEKDAVKVALSKGSRGGRITNPDAITEELESKDNRGIISQGTKDNINSIMDAASKTTDPNSPKGSIYLGKAGLVIGSSLVNHEAGAITGGLILSNEALAHIAANPEISKLIVEGINLPPESTKAKLIRQGILYSLRGTEQTMLDKNGEKHKVVISSGGVPQIPRQ